MTTDDGGNERAAHSEYSSREQELEVLLSRYVDILNRDGISAAKLFLVQHQSNSELQDLAQAAREVRGLFEEGLTDKN